MDKLNELKFKGIYRGIVVNNMDATYLCRAQIKVYPMFAQIDDSNLPWAVPATSIFSGAGDGFGSVSIPEIGSMVFVFFENGDPYQPVYFAQAPDTTHGVVPESIAGYPFTKAFKTAGGTTIAIDDYNEMMYVAHSSGAIIHISKEGAVTVFSETDTSIVANGSVNVSASSDCSIQSTGNTQIQALNASVVAAVQASVIGLVKTIVSSAALVQVAAPKLEIVADTSVDINSTGVVNIKGTMVNLN